MTLRSQGPGHLDRLQRHRLGCIALIVCVILVGVLQPGPEAWPNHLRWQVPGPGLQFGDVAQVLGERPIVSRTGELTLEVWLVPDSRQNSGNQEIVSFYNAHGMRPLVVGQFSHGFLLRGRADNPKGNPREDRYLGLRQAGLTTLAELRHLAVTVAHDGTHLFVNGRATSLALPKTIAQAGIAFGGRLMLGNSGTGWLSWHGGLFALAVYERVLAPAELSLHANDPNRGGDALGRDSSLLALYRFDEGKGRSARSAIASGPSLRFPDRITTPTLSNFLALKGFWVGDQSWIVRDIMLNILGFIPFGFAIAWKKPARVIGVAFVVGCALSLSVEMAQSLIPGRNSSLIDLMSNGVGTLVGAVLTRIGSSSAKSVHRGWRSR